MSSTCSTASTVEEEGLGPSDVCIRNQDGEGMGRCASRFEEADFVPSARQDGEDMECCAICFEQAHFVSLPCSCKLKYCAMCWDRALAASVAASGRARCPSCRAALRVEFDPASGCLSFSPGADSPSDGWRESVLHQARPLQIKLLQQYGNTLAKGSGSEPSRQGSIAAAPKEQDEAVATFDRFHVVRAELHEPLCVCGSQMERVTARERIARVLREMDTSFSAASPSTQACRIDHYVNKSLVTCDLCGEVATRSGACWMCKTGHHTIFHPAAYDVCEPCFDQYTGSQSTPCASHVNSSKDARNSADCAHVVCNIFPRWCLMDPRQAS